MMVQSFTLNPVKVAVLFAFNPCPAEHRFILFENTVDPDQLTFDEAI